MGLAKQGEYDVAVVFSQDSDLSEAAVEIRRVAREQDRWIKIASAFPNDPERPRRGINLTDWLPISRSEYNRCLDTNDYRDPGQD